MPTGRSWADMAASGSSPEGGNSPITASDVQAARAAVTEAQLAVKGINILDDLKAYEAKQTVLAERIAAFDQISAAAKANEDAAAATATAAVAAAATPSPPAPTYRDRRPTDGIIEAVVTRIGYDLRSDLTSIVREELAQLTAEGRTREGPSLTGLPPPSPPKYNGSKGPGKLSVEACLMQFLDRCELHSVRVQRRVCHAVQALEGDALQIYHNLMHPDGRNPDD